MHGGEFEDQQICRAVQQSRKSCLSQCSPFPWHALHKLLWVRDCTFIFFLYLGSSKQLQRLDKSEAQEASGRSKTASDDASCVLPGAGPRKCMGKMGFKASSWASGLLTPFAEPSLVSCASALTPLLSQRLNNLPVAI